MAREIWKPVVGYEGFYEVSNLGRVRNSYRRILRDRITIFGYNRAALSKHSVRRDYHVHRLVCAAFLGPAPEGKEVNHINGVRTDNRLCNLEYVTRRENTDHKRVTGTWPAGEMNGRSRLTAKDVKVIRLRHGRGERAVELAIEYGVHKNTIFCLLRGETWSEAA